MKQLVIIAALSGATLVVACGGDSKKSSLTPKPTNTAGASAQKSAGAGTAVAQPSVAATPQPTQGGATKSYAAAPPLTIDTNKKYFATIHMDIGDVRIELYAQDAPQTVNSFVFLARDHYFDGVTFHRVIQGFVAQGGDPAGTGRGGPGYSVPFETNTRTHVVGAVAMAATAARGPVGSQFFIDLAPQDNLNGSYVVFGQVVAGLDVAQKIKLRDPSTATTPGTVMTSVTIEEQ